ncbi:uncharacterized protein EAF01_004716 [Botrytis porri]|uniref:uncharacterized protein n=1 Tax=Botrytis porri TaxID=87229 RepID=UPI001901D0BF|nr:uncharacterized protein EAF01_004716 [Botrytis porri]KAF7907129.1 hypothetical protein EAF01_004716 [Botrytis porri]
MAVFNYLNDPAIQGLLGQIHRDIHSNLTEFDNLYHPLAPEQPAERVSNNFFDYLTRNVDGRIAQLRAGWQIVLDNDPSERQETVTLESLGKINALNAKIEATVVFNRAPFNP